MLDLIEGGLPRRTGRTCLERALHELSRKMPMLRAEFLRSESGWRQRVAPSVPPESVRVRVWPASEIEAARIELRASLAEADVAQAPLFRAALLREGDDSRVLLAVHRAIGVELDMPDVVLRELSGLCKAQAQSHPANAAPAASLVSLSPQQHRLWLLDQAHPRLSILNSALPILLDGPLDTDALRGCLQELLWRQQALISNVKVVDGRPYFVPNAEPELALEQDDLSDSPGHRQIEDVLQRLEDDRKRGFDLEHEPLIRFQLVRLGQAQHALTLSVHRIACDDTSVGVLLRDLAALYQAAATGADPRLSELPIQFRDYAYWLANDGALDQQTTYWREHLGGDPRPLHLPADRNRPDSPSYRTSSVPIVLSHDFLAATRRLARQGYSLFVILLAAYAALIWRLAGQGEFRVASVVANRSRPELEGLVGLFENTVLLQMSVSGDLTVRQLLDYTRDVTTGALANQDVPFERIVEMLDNGRTDRTRIVQLSLLQQEPYVLPLEVAPGLTFRSLVDEPRSHDVGMVDLRLSVRMFGDDLRGSLTYSCDLFDRGTAEVMVQKLVAVLLELVGDLDRQIADLNVPDD